MPMQLEAVLAKREKAKEEHKPARPPNVLVDGVYVRGWAAETDQNFRHTPKAYPSFAQFSSACRSATLSPPHVQGSADPKQKPVLRHVIVKDLNKAVTSWPQRISRFDAESAEPPNVAEGRYAAEVRGSDDRAFRKDALLS